MGIKRDPEVAREIVRRWFALPKETREMIQNTCRGSLVTLYEGPQQEVTDLLSNTEHPITSTSDVELVEVEVDGVIHTIFMGGILGQLWALQGKTKIIPYRFWKPQTYEEITVENYLGII